MSKLPPAKSIEILGFTFMFQKLDEDAADQARAYGWAYMRRQVIRYCPTDTQERIKDTILHELMHAIHHLMGLGDCPANGGEEDETAGLNEERRVKILSTGLRKVMLDNPGLAEYLFSK